MSPLTLGLDLGPNSIGWALIDEEAHRIVNLGVRIFPEGVDNFDTAKEVSRNEARRTARAMRRGTKRRQRRRRRLREGLIAAGLFPSTPEDQTALLARDPYDLRARALDEKLSSYELGRVFLHLATRRGFLSNRKKDRGDKEVQGMLGEISQLEAEMAASSFPTLGKLLQQKARQFDHAHREDGDHVRNRHTKRQMYEDEFNAIWDKQRALGHASLLTEELKYGRFGKQEYPTRPRRRPKQLTWLQAFGIHGLMFFQRKMYWPRSAVGACDLEPKQPRCPRADRRAQRFRLLQEVNNLRYVDPVTRDEQQLDPEQRALLLDKLARHEKMTFDQIREALGFLESVKFNLEKGKRSFLSGMIVDCRMAKALGKSWHDRDDAEKDAIVALLIENEREDDAVASSLTERFKLSPEQAEAALDVDFPAGHVQLSLKAINKLLPHLERGLVYQSISDPRQSALHAAGYLRRDELQRRLFDKLPDPGRVRDCPIGDLPNPVVKRTLVEVRKLVNAILGKYGKPAAIHVEMGRDVKTRPADKRTDAYRKYQERLDEMRQREERRSAAAAKLRENGITVNRDNINRYLLWEDQEFQCMYSYPPRTISFTQLFGGEVHIDHILPYARCLDDSQNNKAVCFRDANADKGDRTPHEWLAHARPQQYDEICQRAGKLMRDGRIPYAKYRRFLQKELKLDDFIERQLNDTRYIARATAEYLRCLFDGSHHVLGLKGQLTAELRHQWGLENLLAELPDSPAWHGQNDLRPGEKNRADHRHHAVDAVVIALTNRRRLQELARIKHAGGTEVTGELVLDPWLEFRQDLKAAVATVNVSHRSERKVSGRLHEDTRYGRTERDGMWVSRKPIESLSPNEVENIRDPGIRRIIIARLRDQGVDFGRGAKVEARIWKKTLADLKMPSGVPIKRIRVVKPDLTIVPVREGTPNKAYVKPGATHHLCIFAVHEGRKAKYEPVFVPLLEAVARLKRGEPIIQRTHPKHPEAQFVMSLSRGEMVLVDWDEEPKLLVFKTGASTQGQLYFAEHTDARKSDQYRKFVATANSLIRQRKARKVTVDRIGRIRWAGD